MSNEYKKIKIPFVWESLSDGLTFRVKVIGGWLIRNYQHFSQLHTFCFIPDEHHQWEIE